MNGLFSGDSTGRVLDLPCCKYLDLFCQDLELISSQAYNKIFVLTHIYQALLLLHFSECSCTLDYTENPISQNFSLLHSCYLGHGVLHDIGNSSCEGDYRISSRRKIGLKKSGALEIRGKNAVFELPEWSFKNACLAKF